MSVTRRDFLAAGASAAASVALGSPLLAEEAPATTPGLLAPAAGGFARPVVIASANGIRGVKRAYDMIVHDMALAIVDNLDHLPNMNRLFRGLKSLFEPLRIQGRAALEFGGVPLYPGAVRAYTEAGWLK